MDPRAQTRRLRRRNALWQQLRTEQPGTPDFEAILAQLSALTGWDRPRLLAGLGLNGAEGGADER